ncbi:receptor-type tyrosine-protein phosphatase beta isoform X2 [Hydra vulgaris]
MSTYKILDLSFGSNNAEIIVNTTVINASDSYVTKTSVHNTSPNISKGSSGTLNISNDSVIISSGIHFVYQHKTVNLNNSASVANNSSHHSLKYSKFIYFISSNSPLNVSFLHTSNPFVSASLDLNKTQLMIMIFSELNTIMSSDFQMNSALSVTLKKFQTSKTVSHLKNTLYSKVDYSKLHFSENLIISRLSDLKITSGRYINPTAIVFTSVLNVLPNVTDNLPTDVALLASKHALFFSSSILQSRIVSISHEAIYLYIQAPFNAKKLTKIVIFVQELHHLYLEVTKVSTWYYVNTNKTFRFYKYCAKMVNQSETNALLENELFVQSNQFLFKIGVEVCEDRNIIICNGPLKPNHNYRIQIEFYYHGNLSVEAHFTSIYHTSNKISKQVPFWLRTNIVVLIVLCASLFILVFVFTVIFGRKKYTRNRKTSHENTQQNTKSALVPSCQNRSAGKRKFDLLLESEKSVKGMTRPVSIRDFKAWVDRSTSDSGYRFAEEFESMRDVGKLERHEVASIPENRGKNRYTNVLPYDYTRVKLSFIDDEQGSDYINANYIHGYKNPRAYIATQGPLPSTTEDFWRMVWEQNSNVVVMLTQYMERGKVKCSPYWPTTTPIKYGDVTVKRLSEHVYMEWVERQFLLMCDGEKRTITHCQYTAWPDHGVPKSSIELLQFIQTVRTIQQPTDGPLICHCSAGVGRTGTYICIDIIMNKLQAENNIDVYGVVSAMRTQRSSMVQTEDQYIFIHRVILDYLIQKETTDHIFILKSGLLINKVNGRTFSKLVDENVELASEALLSEEKQYDISKSSPTSIKIEDIIDINETVA